MSANGRGVLTFKADTHQYAIDGVIVPSVTQILTLGGVDTGTYDAVNPDVLDYARERGEKVDLACDLIDQGALDWSHLREKATMLVPYAEAWQAFRRSEPFQPDGPREIDGVATYQDRVWSKPLAVAGQLDRRGSWKGAPAIVDIKAVSKLFWHYGIQLAGYTVLWLLGEGVALGAPMRKEFAGVRRKVVHLKKNGQYVVEPYDDPEDLDVFLGALVVAQAKRKHAR
jgi:hypothetical protein